MKHPSTIVKLNDFLGAKNDWTIDFKALKGMDGVTDYDNDTISVDSRLKNPWRILNTLYHELDHVTLGPVLGELIVKKLEANRTAAIKALKWIK